MARRGSATLTKPLERARELAAMARQPRRFVHAAKVECTQNLVEHKHRRLRYRRKGPGILAPDTELRQRLDVLITSAPSDGTALGLLARLPLAAQTKRAEHGAAAQLQGFMPFQPSTMKIETRHGGAHAAPATPFCIAHAAQVDWENAAVSPQPKAARDSSAGENVRADRASPPTRASEIRAAVLSHRRVPSVGLPAILKRTISPEKDAKRVMQRYARAFHKQHLPESTSPSKSSQQANAHAKLSWPSLSP
ncbi:hypothetical protein FVE85_2826 [Porphyridium purpureum]|uniref:Uncharacterized protein n=1 Tax=Porphyridium purpureum TaxID=35688 RepID=A0A5J4YTN2_PORPP|nr:hypothetical protein FVE85_2826 [Porphyridium purpureum]|eukprot:POR0330..scf227_4